MNIYELIGFIIGDGNIYYNKKRRVYRLELVGNVEEDYDYIDDIEKFLIEETGKKPIKFIRKEKKGKSLRIQFNCKKFVDELISRGLPIGKKTFTITIPKNINKREHLLFIIKGLFEADGCLYFSKSKKINNPSYPRIEISTSSKELALQVKEILEKESFKVYIKNGKNLKLQISGEKALNLWIEKIGLDSLKNKTKYEMWKTKGFYIPHTNLKTRITMCAGGTAATATDFLK